MLSALACYQVDHETSVVPCFDLFRFRSNDVKKEWEWRTSHPVPASEIVVDPLLVVPRSGCYSEPVHTREVRLVEGSEIASEEHLDIQHTARSEPAHSVTHHASVRSALSR